MSVAWERAGRVVNPRLTPSSGAPVLQWRWARYFSLPESSLAQDPTITDVHTQPADAEGNIVGRVLPVATGLPRLMAVTVDTSAGPRAYVGLAYAYHEQIKEDFERLTDEAWHERLNGGAPPPAEVPWMQDLVARP